MPAQNAASKRQGLDIPPVRGFQRQVGNHSRKRKWEEAFKSPLRLAFCLLFSFWHAFHWDSNTNWPQSCHAFLCIYLRDIWCVSSSKIWESVDIPTRPLKRKREQNLWSTVQCGRSVEISLRRFSLRAQSERPRGKRRELSHVKPLEFFSLSPHAGESSPLISQI